MTHELDTDATPNSKKGNLVPIMELTRLCKKFGFTRATIPKQKEDFRNLLTEYFQANPEYLPQKKGTLGMVKYLLK